jgi:phospholipid-binding lipoprotein MlaA
MNFRQFGLGVLVAASLAFGGCATTGAAGGGMRGGADPFEPFNRVVAAFNAGVDKVVVKPASQAYRFVTPQLIQGMVGNFFSNLDDVWVSANNLLQGKPKAALSDITRFTINTLFGFLGTVDIATELGLTKNREDFGQTLGVWGVPPGPYVMLPILGPSSARDASALILDSRAYPLGRVNDVTARYSLYGLRAIDTRAGFLLAEKFMDNAAVDDYAFLRNGFFQRRFSQIYDGNPPESAAPKYDDDADDKAQDKAVAPGGPAKLPELAPGPKAINFDEPIESHPAQ